MPMKHGPRRFASPPFIPSDSATWSYTSSASGHGFRTPGFRWSICTRIRFTSASARGRLTWACCPSHPLARLKSVPPVRLDGEKYVAFDKGLVIHREVDRFLRQHGATVDVQFEFDNIENIKKAIAIGAGVALLPAPTLRQELEAGTLRARPLEGGGLVRPLGIIHRRQTRLGHAALGLIDLLRENGTNGTGDQRQRRRTRKSGAA